MNSDIIGLFGVARGHCLCLRKKDQHCRKRRTQEMKRVFTGALLSIALLSLRSPAQDEQHTGLTAGGTVIRHRGDRPFVAGKNFTIWFTRDFHELLSIAETSDIDSRSEERRVGKECR